MDRAKNRRRRLRESNFCFFFAKKKQKTFKRLGLRYLSKESQSAMIPPVNSLVRYDNPILVATSKGKKGDGPKAPAAVSQTEDILNSILPPRCQRK